MDLAALFWTFALVVARLSPLFAVFGIPPFSQVPKNIRLLLVITLSAVLVGNVTMLLPYDNAVENTVQLLTEVAFGLVFIFPIKMMIGAMDMTGKTIDAHMGFGAVNVLNPLSKEQASIVSNILTWTASLILVVLDLHLDIIAFASDSLKVLPPGEVNLYLEPSKFISALSAIFVSTILLFFPIFASLYLIDLIIALVARTMPQMNVYFVTLPLKIFVGILLLTITLSTSSVGLVQVVRGSVMYLQGI